ncbi:efflux RND transporter permease subunit [Microbaculum marinisediminis]|uniref:Efflux RND transporter permease subunit n=1 Tax=Microbaculum marinisediminis TaxID=2931392 RepID=A0AAW5QSV5_9HYPH|nr:efflux RND transporter permease subunit [Microbaculum sp. A6E488]MCT8970967.1 efflux RND transporter permease subunit [Microbaculum sp. A6E488]
MTLSEICIRRPVFATVLSLVIVLVGLVSYDRLSVREYPNIDPPVVSVDTTYPGASAEIIETKVTNVLEDTLAGIEGIDFMTSTSRQERSQISITFNLDRSPADAAADVRDRVSRVRRHLPDEIDEPTIRKVEADAQAVIYLSLYSTGSHSSLEVSEIAEKVVKDQLQSLPGVAQIGIYGDREYAMRIWLDIARMAGYGVTVQDVEAALRQQNVEIPAGLIESRDREFTVLSETDLKTVEEFNDLIIRQTDTGYLVRLADVGRAEIGPRNEDRNVRFKGNTAVAIGVIKQATANPLDISREVKAALPRIEESLPEGMVLTTSYDRTLFIQESIRNVYVSIGEAIVLVVLIIFLFLRSLRATIIPLVTIPVSLIGAFALMYLFGFSINTLTLLAMVLAIGLVVDDAIVMLENIHRHIEDGMAPMAAAFRGAREIGFAIIAMTLTLAAVYVPIGFMEGSTGRLFTEFALALAGAVLVSGFVALTATPMMCAKLLKHQTRHNWLYRIFENGLNALTAGYRGLLRGAMRVRPLIILVGLAVAGSSYFLIKNINSELAPYEDQGTIVSFFSGPEGATVAYTDRYARQIEDIFAEVPDLQRYFVIVGTPLANQGIAFLGLNPWSERTITAQQVAGAMMPKMGQVAGVRAFPSTPAPLGQSIRSSPVEFVIQTSRPYEELQGFVETFVARATENEGLVNVDSDLKLTKPQLKVQVDREKVADVGVDLAALGRTLETLLGGRQVTRFKRGGDQYDVVVQIADVERSNPDDLRQIYVRSAHGDMVQLSNLVTVEETVAPRQLNHFNQLRSASITASLAPGYSLGQALDFMNEVAAETLPLDARTDYGGQSREFKSSSTSIFVTFGLALAFIYLVLAAQFESFRSPLIIMLTVPLSITGGLLALWLDGSTLNIYSQVGLVTLIGLITKHGILIVEFTNQLRAAGKDMRDAVIEASVLRLRPILMTTGAMVLGAVPLAIATGAGAESRQDIGLVIVGGLMVGTFFTLFVIPVVYTYIASRKAPGASDEETAQIHAVGKKDLPQAAE